MNFSLSLTSSLFHLLLIILGTGYLFLAIAFFRYWLKAVFRDPIMDAEEMFVSKLMLAIATLFWPIVVPFCYLELLHSPKRRRQQVESD